MLYPTENLAIIGLTPRAVLYGVYTLFSEFWGVRWFTADVEYYPQSDSLEINGELNYLSKPKFEFRMMMDVEAQDPDFAARNRMNLSLFAEEQHGGKIIDAGKMTHTFYALVPPAEYYNDHPEYFSLIPVKSSNQAQTDAYTIEDGVVMPDPNLDLQRQGSGGGLWGSVGQLCLTNPDVLNLIVQKILQWHEEQPSLIGFAVAQNDGSAGYCQCSECMALNQERGAYSGSLIDFVSKVAERVNAEIPNTYVFTLAYTYSETPPSQGDAHPKVVVALCHMRSSCDSHPLAECPTNARFVEHLHGWQKITQNLVIWHYVVDFANYLLPIPNLYALSKDIPWYYEQGVKGVSVSRVDHTYQRRRVSRVEELGIDANVMGSYQRSLGISRRICHGILWPSSGIFDGMALFPKRTSSARSHKMYGSLLGDGNRNFKPSSFR